MTDESTSASSPPPAAIPESGIVSGERFRSLGDLREAGARAASALHDVGVWQGDIVALLLRNDFACFEAGMGASLLGASTVPLNWHLTADEIGYILDDCGAKVLIAHADLLTEAVLAVAVAVFYDTTFRTPVLTVGVALVATVGIAAAGAVYGALAARLRSGTTLLPLLLLPLLAPVLIGATRGFEVALGREAGPGWPWVALLGIFAVVYLTLGALLFRPLLEDA